MTDAAPSLNDAAVAAKRHAPWIKPALIAGKFAVSGFLLWFLISKHVPSLDKFSHVKLLWVALGVAILFAQPVLNSMRWRFVLARFNARPPFRTVFAIYYASLFFTQILPAIGGDIARVLYHKRLETRTADAACSVIIDRVLALFTLLALLAIALPITTRIAPLGVAVGIGSVAAIGLFATLGAALLLPIVQRLDFWARLPATLRAFADAARWSLTSATAWTRLFPISLSVHAISIASIYCAARSVGMEDAASLAIAAGPVMLLAQALPVSVGGWGMREMAAVLLLQGVGAAPSDIVIMSVVFGLSGLVMALPGAAAWLSLKS